MADTWDEDRLIAAGFEPAYIELVWYEGPRAGLALVQGRPHYFRRLVADLERDPDEYHVWPASQDVLRLEREQWAIFIAWREGYKAGMADPSTHPGHGGVDARYDELDALLEPHREAPDGARRLVGEMRYGPGVRYRLDGLDYWFRWRPVA